MHRKEKRMRPDTASLVVILVLSVSACNGAPVPATPTPDPRPTEAPPTSTTEPSATPVPSATVRPATDTPVPQPILLRRPCGRDYVVRAGEPLQIFYGGWGVLGQELADQWATSLVIDGQTVTGKMQAPALELPHNCRPSRYADTFWIYSMTLLPGLEPGVHDVTVTFSSLRPLPDGSGPVWGPGEMLENTFHIEAR